MSMSFSKRIREKMESVTFCYAREGGAGFIEKENCECGKEKCCQALKDHERFIQRFDDFFNSELSRDEIIKIIKPEFKDSKWWKENVTE